MTLEIYSMSSYFDSAWSKEFLCEGGTFFFRPLRFNLAGITSFFLSLSVETLSLLRHWSWKFLLLILAVRLQVEKLQDLFYYFRLWYRELTSVKFVLFHLLLYPLPKVEDYKSVIFLLLYCFLKFSNSWVVIFTKNLVTNH